MKRLIFTGCLLTGFLLAAAPCTFAASSILFKSKPTPTPLPIGAPPAISPTPATSSVSLPAPTPSPTPAVLQPVSAEPLQPVVSGEPQPVIAPVVPAVVTPVIPVVPSVATPVVATPIVPVATPGALNTPDLVVPQPIPGVLSVRVDGKPLPADTLLLVKPGQELGFETTATLPAVSGRLVPNAVATDGLLLNMTTGQTIWRVPAKPGLCKIRLMLVEETPAEPKPDPLAVPLAPIMATREMREVSVYVMHPFDRTASMIDNYPIGVYPNERGGNASAAVQRIAERYAPPQLFVRVTRDTAGLALSPHFKLGDFAPLSLRDTECYLAIQPQLVAFLEELQAAATREYGIAARVAILRSYLTPNEQQTLRQKDVQYPMFSRLLYGDSAVITVSLDDKNGMGDLNKDGRVDREDANLLATLVDQVQSAIKLPGGLAVSDKPLEPDFPAGPCVMFDLRGIKTWW